MSARENRESVHMATNDTEDSFQVRDDFNHRQGRPHNEQEAYGTSPIYGGNMGMGTTPNSQGFQGGLEGHMSSEVEESGLGTLPSPTMSSDSNSNSGWAGTPHSTYNSDGSVFASSSTTASELDIGAAGEAIQSLFTPLPGETLEDKHDKDKIIHSIFSGLVQYGNHISHINVNNVLKSKDNEIAEIRRELEARNNMLLAELEQVKNELNFCNKKCDSQQNALKEYERKYVAQIKTIEELQLNMIEKDETIIKLETGRNHYEKMANSSAAKIENQKGEISKLKRNIAVKNETIKNQKDEIKELKQDVQELRMDLEDEKYEFRKLRAKIERILEEANSQSSRKRVIMMRGGANDGMKKRYMMNQNDANNQGGGPQSGSSSQFQDQQQSEDGQLTAPNIQPQNGFAAVAGNSVGIQGGNESPSPSSSNMMEPTLPRNAPIPVGLNNGPPPLPSVTLPPSVMQVMVSAAAQKKKSGSMSPNWTMVTNPLRKEMRDTTQAKQREA